MIWDKNSIRSIRYQLQSARFPIHRDLAGFDFEAAKVDGTLINQLAGSQFTDAAHNGVLMGGTGTGKTHLATALGVKAITDNSKRVRFYSTIDWVTLLEREKASGNPGKLAYRLMQMDLVILDEVGACRSLKRAAPYCFICYRSYTSVPASSLPPT